MELKVNIRLTHDDKELRNKYSNFVNFFSGENGKISSEFLKIQILNFKFALDLVYSYADNEGEQYELEDYYGQVSFT